MGTRSRIGVMHGDKVKSVYCHWDGYLDHNGVILQGHYYDSAKANHLVALGDMSSLRSEIGEKHAFSRLEVPMDDEVYDKLYGNMTTFYGRDRGEKDVEFQVAHTFAEFLEQCDGCCAEYYYIMKDGVWYCGDTYEGTPLSKKLTLLTEALVLEKILDEQA
jgi:hypothetical protein